MNEPSRILQVIGPMPAFPELAEALWGCAADVDSDGDSATAASTNWRELTLALRPACTERVDIDPLNGNRDRLRVRASSSQLLDRACGFLIDAGCAIGLSGSEQLPS